MRLFSKFFDAAVDLTLSRSGGAVVVGVIGAGLTLVAMSVPTQAAILGNDDRRSVVFAAQAKDLHRSIALGLLTGVQTWKTSPTGQALLDIDANPLSEHVCKDERFSAEPSVSYACTGFLVGPDLLATAGHCQVNVGVSQNEPESFCKVYDWLFDYEADMAGQVKTTGISTDKVYHCKRIIYAVNDEHAPYNDYALVQLDRPVVGRTPLKLAAQPAKVGDSVSVIGFPLGGPMKYADQAHVRTNNPESPAYLTDLDVMDGDSGAPVFNQQHEVIGILISGEPAELFYKDPTLGCDRYNRCDQNGLNCSTPSIIKSLIPVFQTPGGDVMRIAPLKALVDKALADSPSAPTADSP